MKIIDTHTHVTTESAAQCDAMLDSLATAMEEAGVAGAVVMPLAYPGFDAAHELPLLVRQVQKYPACKPMLCYDPHSGEAGRKALLELLESEPVAGVKFFPGYDSYTPTDDCIAPVLDLIERKGVVAKFHTGATERGEPAQLRFCSDPCSFDTLAANRPALTIDCAHFMAPNHIAMAPVLDKNSNVHADLSGLIDRYSNDDDCPYAAFVRYRLADALSYLPTIEQIMFGSDYPFCKPSGVAAFVRSFFEEYDFFTPWEHHLWYATAAGLYGFNDI